MAHSTFRRIGDEEGTEAALKAGSKKGAVDGPAKSCTNRMIEIL